MRVLWLVSVALFRPGAFLPLVVGVLGVTKDIEKDVENLHPDDPEQRDKQPPDQDYLSHGYFFPSSMDQPLARPIYS